MTGAWPPAEHCANVKTQPPGAADAWAVSTGLGNTPSTCQLLKQLRREREGAGGSERRGENGRRRAQPPGCMWGVVPGEGIASSGAARPSTGMRPQL